VNPDPLHHPEPVIRCRRCGEPLPFGRINTCDDCQGRGGNAAGVVVLAFLALIVCLVVAFVAAPRSGSEGSPPPAQSGASLGTSRNHPQPDALDASRSGAGVERRSPAGDAPRYRGTATHYCLPGQRGTAYCTRGYGPEDMVAAIDTDLGFDKGDVVVVRSLAGDEQVTVTIVDVCGCPGNRLIDLTSGAFRRLAPLGLGVIPVTVELGGAERTLPPTDQEGAKP
jgi:hypothetical protein